MATTHDPAGQRVPSLADFMAFPPPTETPVGSRSRRESRWVSLSRACEILGVNESTVRRWADAGEVQMFRTPGGHRRFDEGDLIALVERGGRRAGRDMESATVSRIRRELHSRDGEPDWYRETGVHVLPSSVGPDREATGGAQSDDGG